MNFKTHYFCAQNNNVIMDLGYNLFKKEPEKPFIKQPDLTVPKVYDPTKNVVTNLAGGGNPSGADIAAHYRAKNAATTPTTRTDVAVDPNSDKAGIDALKTYFTTPEEEERKRRASLANQRIAAVGDALRHIGNIYYTTKGAPAQKFNEPVKEEYERYQKEKALRDKNNQYYMTYQRAKAQQDALAAYNAARLEEAKRANKAREDEAVRWHDITEAFNATKENNRQEEKAKDQGIRQQEANTKEGRAKHQNALDDIRIANGGRLPGKGSASGNSSSTSGESKGGKGGSKKGAKEDKDAEYYRIKARDPKGVASVSSGYKGSNKGERAYIVDEYRKKYGGGAKQKAGNTKGSSKKSTGGKKSTGVTWK